MEILALPRSSKKEQWHNSKSRSLEQWENRYPKDRQLVVRLSLTKFLGAFRNLNKKHLLIKIVLFLWTNTVSTNRGHHKMMKLWMITMEFKLDKLRQGLLKERTYNTRIIKLRLNRARWLVKAEFQIAREYPKVSLMKTSKFKILSRAI